MGRGGNNPPKKQNGRQIGVGPQPKVDEIETLEMDYEIRVGWSPEKHEIDTVWKCVFLLRSAVRYAKTSQICFSPKHIGDTKVRIYFMWFFIFL